jgi:hypothetical protein
MIKTFEKFNLLKDVMNKFNKLAHVTRLSLNREMERDYHQLVRKFNIPDVAVINKMAPTTVSELEKELDTIIVKYPQLTESVEIKDDKIGKEFWFEYHCNEGEDSPDYPMYLHSHQKCTILSISEPGIGETDIERYENAAQRLYKVRFSDGFEWDAFEDEILDSEEEYQRPDPPKKK